MVTSKKVIIVNQLFQPQLDDVECIINFTPLDKSVKVAWRIKRPKQEITLCSMHLKTCKKYAVFVKLMPLPS